MGKPYILISLNTKMETVDWSVGEAFLKTLSSVDNRLVPEFISNREEKIDQEYCEHGDAESIWAPQAKMTFQNKVTVFPQNFCWKRKRVCKSEGTVWHTQRVGERQKLKMGMVLLKITSLKEEVDYFGLFVLWCKLFKPTFGMLHLFTEPELGDARFSSPENKFRLGPVGIDIQEKGIPDLAWATFFGDNLACEVDQNCLANLNVCIDKLENGFLVKSSDGIFDIKRNYFEFHNLRKKIKSCFKDDLFLM